VIVNVVILGLVTLQRLCELVVSRRNTLRLLEQGGREYGKSHYPWIVAVHGFWLASLWALALSRPIDGFWLAIFVLIEIARIWVLATLGARWTTRIIVLPQAPLVAAGPYRFVNHPNYWVVTGEIAVLPLAFELWQIAIVFTLLNAAVLAVRIREENLALGRSRSTLAG
jgi:methyltransferase